MNVKLITIGKTVASYLIEGETEYQNRLKHYMRFERIDINELKGTHKMSQDEVKKKEAELILNKLKASDVVILLDENGQDMTSMKFSILINPGTCFLGILVLGLLIAITFLILYFEADSRTSKESSKNTDLSLLKLI